MWYFVFIDIYISFIIIIIFYYWSIVFWYCIHYCVFSLRSRFSAFFFSACLLFQYIPDNLLWLLLLFFYCIIIVLYWYLLFYCVLLVVCILFCCSFVVHSFVHLLLKLVFFSSLYLYLYSLSLYLSFTDRQDDDEVRSRRAPARPARPGGWSMMVDGWLLLPQRRRRRHPSSKVDLNLNERRLTAWWRWWWTVHWNLFAAFCAFAHRTALF